MSQPHIQYILGDMIPPNQGSRLSQDSSLNKTPWENCYISGYEGPNENLQDVPNRERTFISLENFLDLDDETGIHGSPYKFAMLNNPEISHLGKNIISPNW